MKLCLFLISFIVYAEGCARTTGTVVTTLSPTTGIVTTTALSTTITTTKACTKCSPNSFNPNTPDPDTLPGNTDVHEATLMTGMDANGCSTLIVTCTAMTATDTLLSFYSSAIGPRGFPAAMPGPVSMQTLTCTDGQWTFTANLVKPNEPPVTRVITGASCFG